jgi:hypothetical protein
VLAADGSDEQAAIGREGRPVYDAGDGNGRTQRDDSAEGAGAPSLGGGHCDARQAACAAAVGASIIVVAAVAAVLIVAVPARQLAL